MPTPVQLMMILALGLLAAMVICCWLHGYATGKRAEERRMEFDEGEGSKVDARHETLKREWLYIDRGRGDRDKLFARANDWLEELHNIASRELERHPENNPAYDDLYDTADTQTKLLHGGVRPVPLGSNSAGPSAKVWLRIAAKRSARGYRAVEVLPSPFPTHAAIIAALTVMEACHGSAGSKQDARALRLSDCPVR
jgi:hypothetical protein